MTLNEDINLGAITEALNDKADLDLMNLSDGLTNTICTTTPTTESTASSSTPAVVIENYRNGKSWYRVWSDGFCEQGGYVTSTGSTTTVQLLKAYGNTNFWVNSYIQVNDSGGAHTNYGYSMAASGSTFSMGSYGSGYTHNWEAKGYIS